jgi:hypothetical protein
MSEEKKWLFTWYLVNSDEKDYGYEMRLSGDDDVYGMAYLYEYPPGCWSVETCWSELEEFDPCNAPAYASTSTEETSDIFAWANEHVAALCAQKAHELRQQLKVIEVAVRNLSPGIREGEE